MSNRGEVNVYTTRDASYQYVRRVDGAPGLDGVRELWSPERRDNIFQIDANCQSAASCAAIRSTDGSAVQRSPVILVHGFNPIHGVGGGTGTWGALARTLTERGHPVFELRWMTYMRFEEAAGVLSMLSTRVAELTGHRVTVVAHSFGGIVAHQSMMGHGIRHLGDAWYRVPVAGVYQRLITLGSPLSGISKIADISYGLTAGRDDDDLSIAACEAITCFQAGSSDEWEEEIDELTTKLTAIDPSRIGLGDTREGESIRTLHDAWRTNAAHAVPFSTVVSLKKRPFDDYVPDLTNDRAFDLGDGLISIMGQAVLPTHFSENPYEVNNRFDILGALGANFLTRLDARFAAPMEQETANVRGDTFNANGEYFFALRAAHSCAQRAAATDCFLPTTSDAYLIAHYPEDGLVDRPGVGTGSADHPLRFFIESSTHLAEPRSSYAGTPPVPASIVYGTLTRDGQRLADYDVSFQILDTSTGLFVSDAQLRRSDTTGVVAFNAGQELAARYPGQSLRVANFDVIVSAGTGLDTARVFMRQTLASDVDLGDINFTLPPPTFLASASGRVIDGQTESQPIPDVQLFLMMGLNQSQERLQAVADTTTSRRVTTDAGGNF